MEWKWVVWRTNDVASGDWRTQRRRTEKSSNKINTLSSKQGFPCFSASGGEVDSKLPLDCSAGIVVKKS